MKKLEHVGTKSDIEQVSYLIKILYGHENEELAFSLLRRFGSFHKIFRATNEELMKVRGMTEQAASFFNVAVPQFRQAVLRAIKSSRCDSEYSLSTYASALFLGAEGSADYILYLNGNGRLLATSRIDRNNAVRPIVAGFCEHSAKKAVFIKGDVKIGRPTIELEDVRLLLEASKPIVALGGEVVDFIAYRPFCVTTVRRHFEGDRRAVQVDEANKNTYEKDKDFLIKLKDYTMLREQQKRIEDLARQNAYRE